MKNLETALYAGVGMILKGKEKAEKWAHKMAKDAKMESKEGKAFVNKAIKHAEEAKKELSKKVDEAVKASVKKMGFVNGKEVNKLKAEIKKLKAELVNAKKAKKTTKSKKK